MFACLTRCFGHLHEGVALEDQDCTLLVYTQDSNSVFLHNQRNAASRSSSSSSNTSLLVSSTHSATFISHPVQNFSFAFFLLKHTHLQTHTHTLGLALQHVHLPFPTVCSLIFIHAVSQTQTHTIIFLPSPAQLSPAPIFHASTSWVYVSERRCCYM